MGSSLHGHISNFYYVNGNLLIESAIATKLMGDDNETQFMSIVKRHVCIYFSYIEKTIIFLQRVILYVTLATN